MKAVQRSEHQHHGKRQHLIAANALRRSVVMELALALLIVALVAWLGTLSPDPG